MESGSFAEHGEREVETWAQRVKQMSDNRPDWIADFKAHSDPEAGQTHLNDF